MDYLQQTKDTLAELPFEDDDRKEGLTQRAILSALIAIAERPAQELRPVEFFLLGRNVEEKHAHLGRFHRWHVDCEQKICAVIENENGKIRLLHADQVRFLDREPPAASETCYTTSPSPAHIRFLDRPIVQAKKSKPTRGFTSCPLCGTRHDPLDHCTG